MRDLFKAVPVARMKAITDADQPGTFEALVSVFQTVDSDGDVVMPGAFTKTLAAGPKPIVFSHQWDNVPIGQTLSATETTDGLLVKGRLFVADDEDHARAREVYAAMRAGALSEFSWGGRVTVETRKEADDGDVTFELQEIDLVEYGPCLKGANPSTRLLAVKSLANAGILTRDEARVAIGAVGKSDEAADVPDVPEAEPPLADAAEVVADGPDTNGDDMDTDGPQPAPSEGLIDASTLAAVRAGVLTVGEARERLGLPVLPGPDPAVLPADAAKPATADAEPAASTPLAWTLAGLRLVA